MYFTDDLHATLYDPGTPFKMASAVQWTQQKGRASGKRRPWHSKSQGNGGHAFLQRDTYFDSTLANSRLHSPNLSPFELVTRRLSPRTSPGPKGRAPRDRNRLPEERGRGSERRSGVDRARHCPPPDGRRSTEEGRQMIARTQSLWPPCLPAPCTEPEKLGSADGGTDAALRQPPFRAGRRSATR